MMLQNKPLAVLIAGAGIGGVSAAIAMAQRGIKATFVEQAPELGEIGAGLQLQPNVARVLSAMGIDE